MADHAIRQTGTSKVPLGGRGVFSFTVKESGVAEDVTSVQFILKNHNGATLYDATRTSTDITGAATDGGATSITDVTGTGKYQVTYIPPNNGTYTPPAAGLEFSFQVIVVDEDGTADTGAFSVFIVPSEITISDRSAVLDTVRRRTGILQDLHRRLKATQTAVDLGVSGIYELPLVTKNGATLTVTTHYTWNPYASYLTLVSAASDGDEMFIQAQAYLSNDSLNDVIDEAENMVVHPALRPYYAYADLVDSPTAQALVAAHATGRIKQMLTKGKTLEDPTYRQGWELIKEVKDILAAIRAGSMGILNSVGTEIVRTAGSAVGAFIHPDGPLTGRLKAVDRAQRWLGTLQTYWPERDPENIVDIRALQ